MMKSVIARSLLVVCAMAGALCAPDGLPYGRKDRDEKRHAAWNKEIAAGKWSPQHEEELLCQAQCLDDLPHMCVLLAQCLAEQPPFRGAAPEWADSVLPIQSANLWYMMRSVHQSAKRLGRRKGMLPIVAFSEDVRKEVRVRTPRGDRIKRGFILSAEVRNNIRRYSVQQSELAYRDAVHEYESGWKVRSAAECPRTIFVKNPKNWVMLAKVSRYGGFEKSALASLLAHRGLADDTMCVFEHGLPDVSYLVIPKTQVKLVQTALSLKCFEEALPIKKN